jgi:hypothetical protein
MRKFIVAAAVAAAVASPALAQSYDPDLGSGNIVRPFHAHAHRGAYRGHLRAFARVHHRVLTRHHGVVRHRNHARHAR